MIIQGVTLVGATVVDNGPVTSAQVLQNYNANRAIYGL